MSLDIFVVGEVPYKYIGEDDRTTEFFSTNFVVFLTKKMGNFRKFVFVKCKLTIFIFGKFGYVQGRRR
jgi:hypothetical protein